MLETSSALYLSAEIGVYKVYADSVTEYTILLLLGPWGPRLVAEWAPDTLQVGEGLC